VAQLVAEQVAQLLLELIEVLLFVLPEPKLKLQPEINLFKFSPLHFGQLIFSLPKTKHSNLSPQSSHTYS